MDPERGLPLVLLLLPILALGCDDTNRGCHYEGVFYSEGDGFASADGCNSCGCYGGEVACTLRACAPRWYLTCGDPACSGHRPDPAVPTCTVQVAGGDCSELGQTCDPADACNARLICANSDPRQGPTACPISRAEYKRDITYLDDAGRDAERRAVLDLRLATYRYRGDGPAGPLQLGFIIDDVGTIPAVNPDRERVNLYGYTSMAVAAIQAQEREIATLREELAALRRELTATSGACVTRVIRAGPGTVP